MKRGFPRPTMYVREIQSWRYTDDERNTMSHQTYPVPYTAHDDSLARLHVGRVKDCTSFRNCIVCGEWCPDDEVWVYLNGVNGYVEDSGPFHEKCMRLTQAKCPMVKHSIADDGGDSYRFQKVSWAQVGPIIRGKRGMCS